MIDPTTVREATDELLRQPAYQELQPTFLGRAWTELRAWVADVLAELFASPTASTVGLVVAYLVVGAVLVLGVVTVLGLRRRAGVEVVVDVTASGSVQELLDRADALRAAGRLEEALRTRYGALVVALVEADVLLGRPGTTVGEVDAVVAAGLPRAAEDVALAGRSLTEVVYGHRPATATDDAEVATAVDAVRHAVRAGRVTA